MNRTKWSYDNTYQLTREQRSDEAGYLGWLPLTLTQWDEMPLDQWETMELDEEAGSTTYDKQWVYDPLGNRLVQNVDGVLTTSTYDLANQSQTSEDASGVTTFTFDAAGNQILTVKPTDLRTTSTWDDENREIGVALRDGKLTTNTFRYDGLRVEKQDSDGTVRLIYDGQNYLMETDEANEAPGAPGCLPTWVYRRLLE